MHPLFLQIIGSLTALWGLWVLYLAWQRPSRSQLLVVTGWCSTLLALFLWGISLGTDKGVALGVVVWVLLAIAFMLFAAYSSPTRDSKARFKMQQKQSLPTASEWSNGLFLTLMIGPISCLISIAISTALFVVFDLAEMEITGNLTIVFLLFPISWATLAVVLGYQEKLSSRLVTMTTALLVPSALIILNT